MARVSIVGKTAGSKSQTITGDKLPLGGFLSHADYGSSGYTASATRRNAAPDPSADVRLFQRNDSQGQISNLQPSIATALIIKF